MKIGTSEPFIVYYRFFKNVVKKLKKYVELNSDECGMRKRAVGGIYVHTC